MQEKDNAYLRIIILLRINFKSWTKSYLTLVKNRLI